MSKLKEKLILLLLAAVSAVSVSCSMPDSRSFFVKAADAQDGVYSFEFDMADSTASYDFWIYGRSVKDEVNNVEMRVLWTSPSGSGFRETVYMQRLGEDGARELYRSGVVPAENGQWMISIRPVLADENAIAGLGMICKTNLDGTR